MTQIKFLHIKKSQAGARLDVFLAKKLKISRSQAQKMIDNELVTVNNKLPKKAGDRLAIGNIITVSQSSNLTILQSSPQSKIERLKDWKIDIVGEAADYIVINKPAGLLTHPTMADEPNALTKILLKKFPEIKKVGDDPKIRPGIVHRLDKEASGLLVVARTQAMFNHLKQQFKDRKIDKEYLVLVHGKVAKDEGLINFSISRSARGNRMSSIPITNGERSISPSSQEGVGGVAGARDAITEFFVEKRYVNFTLLRVKIHTGRMHQIRAHMLAYNHPVVGDPLYFQKKRKHTWDEKLGRLFLHCTKLGFRDLDDEWKVFDSQLPNELDKFLKILK